MSTYSSGQLSIHAIDRWSSIVSTTMYRLEVSFSTPRSPLSTRSMMNQPYHFLHIDHHCPLDLWWISRITFSKQMTTVQSTLVLHLIKSRSRHVSYSFLYRSYQPSLAGFTPPWWLSSCTKNWSPRCDWNIVESGVKPNSTIASCPHTFITPYI